MWTVSMLKDNAKAALKGFYWLAFVVSVIFVLLTGTGSTSSSGSSAEELLGSSYYSDYDYDDDGDYDGDVTFDYEYGYDDSTESTYDFDSIISSFDDSLSDADLSSLGIVVIAIVIIIMLAAVAYNIFFANPLTVGYYGFFLNVRTGNAEISGIFSQFKSGSYMATVKKMFVYKLKIFLWELFVIIPIIIGVFIFLKSESGFYSSISVAALIVLPLYFIALIPSIIKKYEYFLVPYITAENPSISSKRAFEISSQTMKGEKMHLFGLQMSFIGWYFLGALASSIFTFFGTILGTVASAAGLALIYPYIYATYAEFYCCMKEKAFAVGIAYRDELEMYDRAANA